MKLSNILFTAALLVTTPLMIMAHPGHGDSDGFSVIHYFKEPVHILFPALFVVVIMAAYSWAKKHPYKNKA